jgi:integrase
MAAPKKVDGKWQHRVMVKGIRTSGTFDTKAAALAWEAEQRTAKSGRLATGKTCKDAFDRYEREVSGAKDGSRWESLRLRAFGKTALGQVSMSEVNASHIAAWRDARLKDGNGRKVDEVEQRISGSTVNREMNLLSNVFTIARKEWKWISESPTSDAKRPKESEPRFRRITPAEIDEMCVALGWCERPPVTKQQSVAAAFLFAIETAMRAGEICWLHAGAVTGRVVHLPPEVTKNGTFRDVPLSPRALAILKLCPDGFGITTATLDAMFRKYRNKTTITGLTFHDTRHEAITRLAKKLHVLDLARMTGHKDIKKLMIYYNEAAEDIADKL